MIVMRRGKKSVVRVAECVAALVPVHRTLSLFPNTYRFFDPSSIFVRFSVQNCSRWPIDHVVVVRCMDSQSWFVLFRQTCRTLLPGKRFTTYGLYFLLVFFQSCAKFSSSFSYNISHTWATHMIDFLPYRITIVARTRRGSKQTSEEGLW